LTLEVLRGSPAFAVIVTPGSTAPEVSTTRPEICPVDWATASDPIVDSSTATTAPTNDDRVNDASRDTRRERIGKK
jgi:hypothetical protein